MFTVTFRRWRATFVPGSGRSGIVRAEVVRVDNAFQGVLVPEGRSRVEFGFRPSFLGLTSSLTLLALVAAVVTWWVGGNLGERRRKSVSEG